MDLRSHIEGVGPIADVAAFLNNLPAQDRWQQLARLNKSQQRTLFLKAEASEPVERSDLIAEAGVPVVHRGFNSLMLFRQFEKHMVCGADDSIWGYNEGVTRRFLGPGYFLVRPCEGEERSRASWVVDYFTVPPELPVESWPEVRSNGRWLSFLVYHHTRDYLRRVSDGVLIGSAYKTIFGGERRLDSYFLLMRTELVVEPQPT